MRLIDGDKLIEAIDKWQDTLSLETTAIDCVICDVLDSVVMIIDDMETVEEGGSDGCGLCNRHRACAGMVQATDNAV